LEYKVKINKKKIKSNQGWHKETTKRSTQSINQQEQSRRHASSKGIGVNKIHKINNTEHGSEQQKRKHEKQIKIKHHPQ
jgi:hypothetical protein